MEDSNKTPTSAAKPEAKEAKEKKVVTVVVSGTPAAETKPTKEAGKDVANKEVLKNQAGETIAGSEEVPSSSDPKPAQAAAVAPTPVPDEELLKLVIERLNGNPEFINELLEVLKKHGTVAESKKETVSEKDFKSFPLLNEVGVLIGDTQDEVMGKAFVYIGKLKEEEGTQQQKPDVKRPTKTTKDEVVAVKGDRERAFPRSAWNNLGSNKGGWAQKVETPKEAKGGNQ